MRPIFKTNASTGQVEFTPNPKQAEFIRTLAPHVLFSGGTRGGKTVQCCIKALWLSYMYENNLGIIGRLHQTDLDDTTFQTMRQILDELGWDYEWKSAKHNMIFPNGSVIMWRFLDGYQAKQGLNLGWIFIDQIEEISEDVFNVLLTRLSREPKYSARPECRDLLQIYGPYWQRVTFHTCNPVEEDHWLFKRWKLNEERRKMGHPKYNPRYALVEVAADDNKANLPADYFDQFRGMPKEYENRYRWGKWGGYSGKIFAPVLNDDAHFIDVSAHVFPDKCTHYRSFDHGGLADAGCCLFAYAAPNPVDGQLEVVVYDEYWGENCRPDQHSLNILKMYQEFDYYISYADPQVKDRTQHSSEKQETFSLLDIYRDHGLELTPAFRPKWPGITKVQQWLMVDPTRPHRFLRDTAGKPVMGAPHVYILNQCRHLIEQLKGAHMSDQKPGTVANTVDDAVTALRYLLASPISENYSGKIASRIIKDPILDGIREDVERRREAREAQEREAREEEGDFDPYD